MAWGTHKFSTSEKHAPKTVFVHTYHAVLTSLRKLGCKSFTRPKVTQSHNTPVWHGLLVLFWHLLWLSAADWATASWSDRLLLRTRGQFRKVLGSERHTHTLLHPESTSHWTQVLESEQHTQRAQARVCVVDFNQGMCSWLSSGYV